MAEITFADLLTWSREQGMTKKELDDRAVVACLDCELFPRRCANLEDRDWCYIACTSAINSWKRDRKIWVREGLPDSIKDVWDHDAAGHSWLALLRQHMLAEGS